MTWELAAGRQMFPVWTRTGDGERTMERPNPSACFDTDAQLAAGSADLTGLNRRESPDWRHSGPESLDRVRTDSLSCRWDVRIPEWPSRTAGDRFPGRVHGISLVTM